MTIYLSILEGDTPETTRPVMTTRDPRLLRAFGDAVRERVEEGLNGGEARRALQLLDGDQPEGRTDG